MARPYPDPVGAMHAQGNPDKFGDPDNGNDERTTNFMPALTPSRSFWSLEAEVSNATPRRRVERAMTLNNGKPLDQFSAQRNCSAPGCTARLSRYNPNPTCAAHGGWSEDRQPRRRSRSTSRALY